MSTVLPLGFCRLQWMFWYCPIVHEFSAVRPEERDVRPGLSTARRTARLRYSEESEVVSAGGQRGAICIGQIGVEEEASDSPLSSSAAQLPDPKLLPGGFCYRSTPFTETSVPWKVPKASSPVTR